MKRRVKSLVGYHLGATDGEIGKIEEFYFDDETWTIRYLIVETGNWFFGRKVLISPMALVTTDWENKIFPVKLTKEQIMNSPDLDTEKSVSRQHEIEYNKLHPWNSYPEGAFFGGAFPILLNKDLRKNNDSNGEKSDDNPHLRSTAKVTGYCIMAIDGEIGNIEDFIFEDTNWKIEYLIVDTGKWLLRKKVLILPEWIKEINWDTSSVTVKALLERVSGCDEYDPNLT